MTPEDKEKLSYIIGMALYLKAAYGITAQELAAIIEDSEKRIIKALDCELIEGQKTERRKS